MTAISRIALVACCLSAGLSCGCRAPERARASAAPAALDSNELGEVSYLAPPQILRARMTGGTTVLDGRAPPGARIGLAAPEGERFQATADRAGAWTLQIPAFPQPRMYALTAEVDGRVVHGEGAAILTARPGPPALLVRAGSGALTMDSPGAEPSLEAIDYDAAGFAAVSGLARPHARVRLSIDGAPAGVGQAGDTGQYAVLAANRKISSGPHLASVQADGRTVLRRFDLVTPGPLDTPYKLTQDLGAWRVEWASPGGGVQTTLVFPAR